MVTIIALSIAAIVVYLFVLSAIKRDKEAKRQRERHRIEMLEERNYQLFYFQLRLIKQFGSEVINAMPDYKDILYSDKPLEAKHWVDVDKLVNLN